MKVSVIASLIVGIHVVVVASVAMQGCTATRAPQSDIDDTVVAPPPAPTMPPTVAEPVAVPAPAQPAPFKPVTVQPPAPPKPADSASPRVHVVQNGDVLSKIAKQYGCKTSELKELNGIKDANKILVGQKLLIPDGSGKAPASAAPAKAPAPAAAPVAGPGEYIVRSGDALSKIAAKFGCKTKDLMELNNIKDANKIRIGQKLKIPGAAPAAPAAPAEPAAPAKPEWVAPLPAAEPAAAAPAPAAAAPAPAAAAPAETAYEMEDVLDYTVQNGDTVESIARLFVVSGADIRKLNAIADGEDVKPGKVIKIPPTAL